MTHPHGQALVEFALVMPLVFVIILGAMEAGALLIAKADQDRNVAELAAWSALYPDEPSGPVLGALGLSGCVVAVTTTDTLLTADASCTYSPIITSNLWEGLPIASTSTVALAPPSPAPSPSPTEEAAS